jgi:predicted AlkP superfamily phosphohydrolase/phosphomutase
LLEIEYKEKPVMDKVWFKEEIYDGKYISEAPDIVFSPKEYAFGASAVSPFLENKLFSTPHTLKSGEHRFDGIVGFYPKIKVKNTKRIDIEDLSAAILEYFDVSVPNYFDGQSFLETNNARGKSVVEEIEI